MGTAEALRRGSIREAWTADKAHRDRKEERMDVPNVKDPQTTSGCRSTTARPWPRWATPLAGAVIVLAVMAVYGNSLSGPFVFDDVGAIVDNPTIRQLRPFWQVLSPPRNGETVSGRPLLNLSLALNYASWTTLCGPGLSCGGPGDPRVQRATCCGASSGGHFSCRGPVRVLALTAPGDCVGSISCCGPCILCKPSR